MIKKINSIQNLAVFQNFLWDTHVKNDNGNVLSFNHINVIYGRNYSGKTTLSRIVRAMEMGKISDKYENPAFQVTYADGVQLSQATLIGHNKKIRVFNEDFVRENIRFITNPEDSIEPFAILGEGNNQIEQEIKALQDELGSKEPAKETGLYAKRAAVNKSFISARNGWRTADSALEGLISDKAIHKTIGIKYQSQRYGDQNYTTTKLKSEIEIVLKESYVKLTDVQVSNFEDLIKEKTISTPPAFANPDLNLHNLISETELLVSKKISDSNKIEELVKDAILNRWVETGKTLHQGIRADCALCGNTINHERWAALDKHFDVESDTLKKSIDSLIENIGIERNRISKAPQFISSHFYSKFQHKFNDLSERYKSNISAYFDSLNQLLTQLTDKKNDILTAKTFVSPTNFIQNLIDAWDAYRELQKESEDYSIKLASEQADAKRALRFHEISIFLVTIGYANHLTEIESKKAIFDNEDAEFRRIGTEILQKELLVEARKQELNDEKKGALKVNEYLNNFFGHKHLSLEAITVADTTGSGAKQVRFEVIRETKKAYHLSEGECSLLAFCYFLAKLDDTFTKNSKPIIWIDDPISSLDSNHVFFIYSMINSEIVSQNKFEQIFISTHNLDFLKYLKRLGGRFETSPGVTQKYSKEYYVVNRQDKNSTIQLMPKYLQDYVTEFNYLFHQIYKCAAITTIDDSNYTTFYNFGNNARKFFEIYLYYKYPDQGSSEDTLKLFFGEETIPAILTDRINNEYSHLSGVFERGATPTEVPEMQTTAQKIIERLKLDGAQYDSLLKSIGEFIAPATAPTN